MCIESSVGRGGANKAPDVRTVQVLLNLNGASALAVDGAIGDNTIRAIEAFEGQSLGMATPTGRVDPASPTLAALARGMPAGLSAEKIRGIMINATAAAVTRFGDRLVAKMAARAIDTPLRRAHFLAQVGHESGELVFTEEIANGQAYEGRRDLGNTEPGDGPRFKGRGLIQLTGRANYQRYGTALGMDFLTGDNARRLATDPDLAADVACWFWTTHGLNDLADRDDIEAITRRINGGLNGFPDRQRQLTRAKFFLA